MRGQITGQCWCNNDRIWLPWYRSWNRGRDRGGCHGGDRGGYQSRGERRRYGGTCVSIACDSKVCSILTVIPHNALEISDVALGSGQSLCLNVVYGRHVQIVVSCRGHRGGIT